MATNGGDTHAGLTVHSNFAKRYAANSQAIGHAERSLEHVQTAATLQAMNWTAVESHLNDRMYG